MKRFAAILVALSLLAGTAQAHPLDTVERQIQGRARISLANGGFGGVLDPTLPPYSSVGRLHVSFGEFGSNKCTATAIDTPNRNAVLTAAHCLDERPCLGCRPLPIRWAAFVPAESQGSAPFGAFEGRSFYALRGYRGYNGNFDMAIVITAPNAAGYVADVVGGLDIVMNRPRDQVYQLLGYPGRRQKQMHQCETRFFGDDSRAFRLPGPAAMKVRCHMGEGASGGPWLVDEGTAVNGVTSYGYRTEWATTYSPYFASQTIGALMAGH